MTTITRELRVARLGIAALAAMLLLVGAAIRPVAAQDATPQATPTGGGVPCTALFGIEEGNACVLVINASPDAGPLDIYVDGLLVLEFADYGVLGDLLPVPAGVHQVQVTPSGADVSAAVIDLEVDLEDGVAYEVAAVGLLENLEAQVYPVDTGALDGETARLRVVHASPDAPAVDIAETGGDVLIDGLEFPDASEYLEIAAGTYDLEVRPTGTEDVALPLPGTVLDANYVYSVYAIGQVADGTLTIFVVALLISPDIAAAAGTPVASPAA